MAPIAAAPYKPIMANDKLVLITGATGQQGGATARELLAAGWRVRAMTRKPDGERARALAQLGAEIVAGDLDDAPSLARALAGAWGVYAVQNTWEAGVDREEQQGKRLAGLAREAGVQHYVYASVASAHRATGIPHFDNKWRVEETVRSLEFPTHVIVRPVFFMENLVGPWFLNGDVMGAGLAPTTPVQMIAVEDIGKYGRLAFERADLANRAIDIAGDTVTMARAAAAIGEARGRAITFVQYPIEEVRKQSADMALMLEWFERVGYDADIEGNAKTYGIAPLRFDAWARTSARP